MTPLHWILIVVAVLFLVWIAYGYFGSRAEQLQYTVLDDSKEYEIREVHEHLVAETEVEGSFVDAGNRAFGILAGYIFGNNKSKEKIAMTSPVVSEESEKIAMTAPVITSESEKIAMTAPVITTDSEKIAMTTPVVSKEGNKNMITYAFVLPSKYTMENIPDPVDPRVKIRKVGKYKIAVLRFRGFFTDKNFEKKKAKLQEYLKRDGIEYSNLYSAGYNPPGVLPFMRRNEVWAELK